MDPQVLEALGGTSSSSSSSGAKTCSDSNQAQSDSKPRDDENQENSSSESGWSSWFQNVAKQVQTQTVQAAHRISERAMQAHQEFLQEKERIMNEEEPPTIRRKLPWIRGDGSLPPYWQDMRDQILKLSKDDDTFLQPLPEGTDYEFNIEEFLGIASALLQEDPALGEKRFKLVPRKLKDVEFWRRYSYRVYQVQNTMVQANDDAEHPGWKVQTALAGDRSQRDEHDTFNEAGERIKQSAQDMWTQLTQRARQAHQTFVRDKFSEIQQEEKKQPKQYCPWFRHDGSLPPYWKELKNAILRVSEADENLSEPVPEGSEPSQQEIEKMAEGLLNEDPKLADRRYSLVPRVVSDEVFWQRYVYRIHKIQQKFKEEHEDLDHPGWGIVRDSSPERRNSPVGDRSPSKETGTPQGAEADPGNSREQSEAREEDDSEFNDALQALHVQDNMDWDVHNETQDTGDDDDIEQQIAAELGDDEEYDIVDQDEANYGSDLENLEDEVAQELGTNE